MTRSCTTFFSGTLPARIVCAVLSIVSLALISILRYEHDRDNFKIPMALAIVAMAWFITAAGMAVYVWYGSIAFCPRRAASLAIGGLVAVGCCIGTAIVVGLSDPAATVEARRLENSLIGMQISAAVLEIVNIAVLAYEWHSRTKMTPVATGKHHMGMAV